MYRRRKAYEKTVVSHSKHFYLNTFTIMMQYKVVTRKNPINKTKKFYPALVSPQPVDKTKIIERIEKRCTLASADVKAVLDALEVELID